MPCVAVDLFCGIGGLTHGLQRAGIPVNAGYDIDPSCRYAYEHNNNSRFIEADVSNLTAEGIMHNYPIGSIKVLVGCAPCQPFSKYSQRYRKNGHRDNKWKLLASFARIICDLRPEVVSMENVPELIKESIFNDFLDELTALGYNISWSVVYGPEYGIPQRRYRLVLLASLLGNIRIIPALFNPDNYLTVRDAIGFLPPLNNGDTDPNDSLHCCTKLSSINLERIRQSIPGGTWDDWEERLKLDCHKKVTGKSYSAVYGRMTWDEPSPTITTQFYGYGNGRFGHPEQDRALSYREGALLQSFPQNYAFEEAGNEVNKRRLGVHIGNAVPVELGRVIGISINEHLQEMRV